MNKKYMLGVVLVLALILPIGYSALDARIDEQETLWMRFENNLGDNSGNFIPHDNMSIDLAYYHASPIINSTTAIGFRNASWFPLQWLDTNTSDIPTWSYGPRIFNNHTSEGQYSQFSYCAWLFLNQTHPIGSLVALGDLNTAGDYGHAISVNTNGSWQFVNRFMGTSYVLYSDSTAREQAWTHICVVKYTTHSELYINGTNQSKIEIPNYTTEASFYIGRSTVSTYGWNGSIDDLRFFNNTVLTPSDIAFIYANGEISLYRDPPSPILQYPNNNSVIYYPSWLNITGIVNRAKNTTTITTNSSIFNFNSGNGTNFNLSNVTPIAKGYYSLNISANNSLTLFNSTFLNFLYVPSRYYSQSVPASAQESSTEQFNTTILFMTGENPIVYLNFSGVMYQATQTEYNTNNASYFRSLTMPDISGASETKTFKWDITDSEYNYNSSVTSMSIIGIELRNCSAASTNNTINISFFDEETNASIAATAQAIWTYWATGGDGSNNDTLYNNPVGVTTDYYCVNPVAANLTGKLDYYYTADGYTDREYHALDYLLDNRSENLYLYLLSSSNATTFRVTVMDIAYSRYPGVTIRTLRYNPTTGSDIETESCITDDWGACLTHMALEGTYYRFIIVDADSNILHTTNRFQAYCPETNAFDQCLITIVIPIGVPEVPYIWDEINGWSYVVNTEDQINATNISTLTYSFTAGTIDYVRFLHTQGSTSVCDSNSSAVAAVLTCNLTDYSGQIRREVRIFRDGQELTVWTDYIDLERAWETWGTAGLFFMLLMLMTVCTAALVTNSPLAVIVLTMVMLGVGTVTGLGGLGIGAFMLLAVAAALIIFKLKQ